MWSVYDDSLGAVWGLSLESGSRVADRADLTWRCTEFTWDKCGRLVSDDMMR
jgi:hypothetical protein